MIDHVIYNLARRRTFFFPLGIIIMLLLGRPTWPTYIAGMAIVVLGEVSRFWAAGYIRKAVELTSSGPFGSVRNPLYVGSFIMTLGFIVVSNSLAVAAFALILFCALHTSAILYEERELSKIFGEEYAEYCRSVPRLIPRWPMGGPEQFSWRQALDNSEHKSALFAAVVAAAFAAKLFLR